MTALASTLQAFFTDRLIGQRQASAHTVAAYRDTFRLLLGFAQAHVGKAPSVLDVGDLDAEMIGAFLVHLRDDRHNGPRTRNARLSAAHALFRYAALHHPEHAATIQGVLAVPPPASTRPTSPSSSRVRSRRCWPLPTVPAGSADGTTRSWLSRSRPGCGSPS